MTWLLLGYGEVLALAPAAPIAMPTSPKREPAASWAACWRHQFACNRADIGTGRYWARILGHFPGAARLRRIAELDSIMWSRPNQATFDAVASAAERGVKLAWLFNASARLAGQLDRLPWLASFCPRIFSGHVAMIKPEQGIYALAPKALGAEPHAVTVIDDRVENSLVARRADMAATLFTTAGQVAVPSAHGAAAEDAGQ